MDYDYEIEKRYHPENMLPDKDFLNAILDCGTVDTIEELELEDDEQDEEEGEE